MSAVSPEPGGGHPALAGWEAAGGVLRIGGESVRDLEQRLGGTPFYAYDRARIAARVEALRASLPASLRLHYAVKANPMPAVVEEMAGLVDGGDVASAGELDRALAAGFSPGRLGFAGPGKSDDELARALSAGCLIALESPGELDRLTALAEAASATPRVAVRVNPDVKLTGSGMHMGGGPSQFGVDAEAVPELLARIGARGLDFRGFHIFAGSQNLSAEAVLEAERAIAETAIRLAEHAPAPVRHLNLGGGFGIPYFPKDAPLDLARLGDGLGEIAERIGAALPEAEILLELGRYLVGEAGVYVCRVIERKVSRGQVFLVTDGGLHHHLAATGNFGQTIRRNYPVAVATRFDAAREETASVVGRLCTPLDLLADRAALPAAEPGDLIAVFQSGAYGASASPQAFLSHPPVQETLV